MPAPANGPKHLDLLRIQMPVGAVLSIAHRISGVLMFLSLPFLVYLLDLSLRGPAGFAAVADSLNSPLVILVSILLVWSLLHHLLAGIRHLLLDIHLGTTRERARQTAWATNLLALVLTLLYAGSRLL